MKGFVRIILLLLATTVFVWETAKLDHRVRDEDQTASATKLARQVSSQAEGMALRAREKGEADPLGWSVEFLSQGEEPRYVEISKVINPPEGELGFHANARFYEFKKLITPENGEGVLVRLNRTPLGFLGTRTNLANDGSIAFYSTLIFSLFFLITRKRKVEEPRFEIPPTEHKDLILNWIASAKPLMTQVGLHIRELIRHAQTIATASSESQKHVAKLRENIHAKLHTIHQASKLILEAEKKLANATGEDAVVARKLVQMVRAQILELEKEIEPWSTDIDQAYHSFDPLFETTQAMSDEIGETTRSMIHQLKSMEMVKEEFSSKKSG